MRLDGVNLGRQVFDKDNSQGQSRGRDDQTTVDKKAGWSIAITFGNKEKEEGEEERESKEEVGVKASGSITWRDE